MQEAHPVAGALELLWSMRSDQLWPRLSRRLLRLGSWDPKDSGKLSFSFLILNEVEGTSSSVFFFWGRFMEGCLGVECVGCVRKNMSGRKDGYDRHFWYFYFWMVIQVDMEDWLGPGPFCRPTKP